MFTGKNKSDFAKKIDATKFLNKTPRLITSRSSPIYKFKVL